MTKKANITILGMGIVLLLAISISLAMGSVRVPIFSVMYQVFQPENLRPDAYDTNLYILTQVRLPRIILCTLTGTALGISGSVMQTLFRNPLASPYTMGVSSGASFGAALAMVLGVGIFQKNFLFLASFGKSSYFSFSFFTKKSIERLYMYRADIVK